METRIRGGDSSKRAEDLTVRAGELQMREAAMVSVKRKSMSTENSASGGSVKGEEQMIRWDRFLPRRFLKVLLVESDDSTRHVVAALLRKCSYQVAAVADGLKAWDILKDRNFNFDLVLTEVVMPSLSGIGLLSKIMGNEICKNIPVIMMSSHDSVGIVFKCMLKGAADFLVKPVRKNELRNLWQHVWRKCCSSNYGNGFENGNPECTKVEAVSENEDASNRGSANADGRSKIGDSSHAGSDTQSSCGNPDIEIESMQKQVVAFETEKRSFPEETDSKSDKYDTNSTEVALLSILENLKATDKSKDPEIEVSLSIHRALSSKRVDEEAVSSVRSPCREKEPVHLGNKGSENIDTEPLNQQKGKDLPLDKVNEFIRAETAQRYGCHFSEDIGQDVLCVSAKSFDAARNGYYSRSSPLLELCLRRPQLEGPDEISLKKHVLKHSHVSAFSRYGKASSRPKPSSLCIKADDSGSSNCQIYPSDDKGKKSPFPISERSASSHGYGSEALGLQRQLSSGSNKVDVGPSSCFPAGENACIGCSTTEKAFSPHPRLGFVPFSIPVGAIPFQSLSAGYGAVPPPVIYTEHSAPECSSSEVQKEMASTPSKPSTHNSCDLINNPQHVNCHVYDGNQHLHRLMQGLAEQRVKAETAFPRVHSHTPVENANLRGNFHCGMAIARGSNGSYENTSLAVNSTAAFENGNEDGFQTGNEKDGFQNGHGKDVDSDRSRREAALTKFRLKRKDRCFEKKVRYHNRKKLAEQRPRLKGQFVRQAVVESSTIAAESDD